MCFRQKTMKKIYGNRLKYLEEISNYYFTRSDYVIIMSLYCPHKLRQKLQQCFTWFYIHEMSKINRSIHFSKDTRYKNRCEKALYHNHKLHFNCNLNCNYTIT